MKVKKLLKRILSEIQDLRKEVAELKRMHLPNTSPYTWPNELDKLVQPIYEENLCVGPGNGCPMTNIILPTGGMDCTRCGKTVYGMQITCQQNYSTTATIIGSESTSTDIKK